MTDYLKTLIQDQFEAALSMLEKCVTKCPEEHWEGRIGNAEFWRVAFHTLFFVDMYLSPDESCFQPPDYYQQGDHDLGREKSHTDTLHGSDTIYSKSQLLKYITHCQQKISNTIAAETQESLEMPSGFPWYPMSRGEHHLASIRHIQHHVGQLSAFLIKNTGKGVEWIGKLHR